MLVIGNEELEGRPKINKGDLVSNGKLRGHVEFGTDISGKECRLLGFINTDKNKSYLVAVNEILLERWEKVND